MKRAESGMVLAPVTVRPSQSLREALGIMREHDISGVPVVEGDRPVGILTARDIRFEQNLDQPVSALMTKELVTVLARRRRRTRRKQLLHKHRIEKLLVVDDGKLVGLITIKDILQADRNPLAVKDEKGRLRVGAAIGPGPDRDERADALVAAGVDVIVDRHRARPLEGRHRRRSRREEGATRTCPSSRATSPPPRRPRRSSTRAPTP